MSIRIEAHLQNTLIIVDEDGNVIKDGTYNSDIADSIKKGTKCQKSCRACDGVNYVSPFGILLQSVNATVGANYCPLKGQEIVLDF